MVSSLLKLTANGEVKSHVRLKNRVRDDLPTILNSRHVQVLENIRLRLSLQDLKELRQMKAFEDGSVIVLCCQMVILTNSKGIVRPRMSYVMSKCSEEHACNVQRGEEIPPRNLL